VPTSAVRTAAPAARTATRCGRAVRLLLPVLGVIVIAALGFAILSSAPKPRAGTPRIGPRSESAAAGTVTDQVRTSTVHGSSAGYDAAVQITRTDVGSSTVTTLNIVLTTQATPASAPSAEARLVAPDHVGHDIALTIVAAGRWISKQFAIAPGRYTLTVRFDRKGAPVTVQMPVVLT
jgi:hypothetical protein